MRCTGTDRVPIACEYSEGDEHNLGGVGSFEAKV